MAAILLRKGAASLQTRYHTEYHFFELGRRLPTHSHLLLLFFPCVYYGPGELPRTISLSIVMNTSFLHFTLLPFSSSPLPCFYKHSLSRLTQFSSLALKQHPNHALHPPQSPYRGRPAFKRASTSPKNWLHPHPDRLATLVLQGTGIFRLDRLPIRCLVVVQSLVSSMVFSECRERSCRSASFREVSSQQEKKKVTSDNEEGIFTPSQATLNVASASQISMSLLGKKKTASMLVVHSVRTVKDF